ncbi:MAG: DKNYY domain-containing protein [Flavobacteriaceae bacterium]|nr:DKNYY domain-containing protein [Flavobacteriaceae bacterium]
MKRHKIILFLLVLVLLVSCKQHMETQEQGGICANDERLYQNLNANTLLYKDTLNILYLKLENKVLESKSPLNDCQKLPYIYVKEVLLNESLRLLGDIVEVSTFKKIINSNVFFKDHKQVYVHQQNPATYPSLKVIDIDSEKAIIFKEYYIKDHENVYFSGIHISKNAASFRYIPNTENLNVFGDTKHIIWNWTHLNQYDFNTLSLSKKVKDSLVKIYFKTNTSNYKK